MQIPSKTVQEAVDEIAKLPGIGKKSALRVALHLLKQHEANTLNLASALVNLRTKTRYCVQCCAIADDELCSICSSRNRDRSVICVVEETKDVIAIESTGQYNGLYFVLNGLISPMHGKGPENINLQIFFSKFPSEEIKEVVLGLSPTMDGDTTGFYISKKLKEFDVKLTTIARGIPVGGELEFTDEVTLGRSIIKRIGYDLI